MQSWVGTKLNAIIAAIVVVMPITMIATIIYFMFSFNK